MSIESNRKLVLEWVEALSVGDADRLCAMYDANLAYYVVGTWPLGGHFGREFMEQNCRDIFRVFPDGLKFTVERVICENDWACLEMRSEGTHISGRTYANHYTYWFEIKNGWITQLKEWLDTLHANDVLCGPQQPVDFTKRQD